VDPIAERVRTHFDEVGDREWERLASTARDWVSFELHRRLLAETIGPADRVLEIGAGPGRFTIELARLGAQLTVTDVSAVQLKLNERHTTEAGCEDAVEARFLLDVRDVATLGEGAFAAVVAYGGPLSYAFEDAEAAFGQLVNVVRPGGAVVASVMAAPGSLR
jgi:cyclopropane fatty-acyl-phospholipid synthase-like methyltransferase